MKTKRKILLPEAPPAQYRMPAGAVGLRKRVAKIPEELNLDEGPLNALNAAVDSHTETTNPLKEPPPLPVQKNAKASPSPVTAEAHADNYPLLVFVGLVLMAIVSIVISQIDKPSPRYLAQTSSAASGYPTSMERAPATQPRNSSSSASTYRPNPYVAPPPPASTSTQSSSSRPVAASIPNAPVVQRSEPSPMNPNSYSGSYVPQASTLKYLKVIGVRRGDTLSMRDRPDPNSRQVGEIPYNATRVKSVDDLKNVAYYGKTPWYKVDWLSRVGWVNGTHLQVADQTEGAKDKTEVSHNTATDSSQPTRTSQAIVMYVKVIQVEPGDRLTMRSMPNPNSSPVGSIPHDATGIGLLTPIAAGVQYGGVKWFKVQWQGRVGWVNGTHLDRY
jgi:hypothetical protein